MASSALEARRLKSWKIIKREYHDVPSRDDRFFAEISRWIREDAAVLDAGCGYNAEVLLRLRNGRRRLVGVSLEDRFEVEPPIRIARANLEAIPMRDASFDLVTLRFVCEHLERPVEVFKEVRRILRDGGRAVLITPSFYYYPSLVAALVPYRLHRFFVTLAFGKSAYANFPTTYRMNTISDLRALAKAADLELDTLEPVRDYPSYLMFSPLLLRIGMAYERLVTRLRIRSLHACFLATFRKAS